MYPGYLKPYHNGKLDSLIEKALGLLECCSICPRKCKVNRLKNELGFCKTGLEAKVYSCLPHFGEEPPISGTSGSGTIFFSHCNMACVYCQNYKFSQEEEGRVVGAEELADFMLQLQNRKCHNINLVTPTHVMPQILEALGLAVGKGLKIPLVYNTSGYELPQIIKLLAGVVDIYLADSRYADNYAAAKYSAALDYPKYNREALLEMQRQAGIANLDNRGIIKKGLIIRHLVLPNNVSGTEKIMEFIAKEVSTESYISLMSQYHPCYRAGEFKEINRRISYEEYRVAVKSMEKYGLYNGWTQDLSGQKQFLGTNLKPIH
ncbi:MAG: radical SAM protein [Candidatus Omnitrophota bacterium]